ncbi:MAG TPA: D-2-hydroxyacid dehydrogenase [Vicinamibacterales bacterium]|nr:D-2-hydroxyacid dehydrogenase [Vicinamibacterales bacterium]
MIVAVGIYSPSIWTLPAEHVDRLRARFPDVQFVEARTHAELADAIEDAEVAFSSLVREDVYARAQKLRWIHSSAAGVGGTLFPALVESDVVLTNSRGIQSASIAEHILAMVLAWRRGIHVAVRRQTQGTWAQDELTSLAPTPLGETRVLIVGMGSIGEATAALFRGLGMQVEGVRRRARDGQPGAESLPDLLPRADIVAITLPHTPETNRLFDAAMLARMKPGSLLVNIGRGRLIDEAALIEGLKAGRPGAAALDVFEREPLSPGSSLWGMENVIVSPHVAGFGADFWQSVVDLFARNLDRWRSGQPLENVVDKRLGY